MSGAVIRVTWAKSKTKDRRRAYSIYVDDVLAGELHRGQTADVAVRAGRHVCRVSVDLEHSRDWQLTLADGDVVELVCRPRPKTPAGRVDLFLADPTDARAAVRPLDDLAGRDMARKQRVVTRDGKVLLVWAHKSGYLRSLHADTGGADPDAFLLEVAYYVLVMPVLGVLRWTRHRVLFKGRWSVGVVRERRFLWPEKVRLERCADEAEARRRAAQVLAEMEGWPA